MQTVHPTQPRPLRFLLVEDDDDHAALMLRNLRHHPVQNAIDRVSDGVEALAYLRREGIYADKARPDVVLLDLNMPRMNGHEVLLRIKQDASLRSIPVVVLTTSDAETDRSRAYNQYANSYLLKPVDFAQLRQMAEGLGLYWGYWNKPCP